MQLLHPVTRRKQGVLHVVCSTPVIEGASWAAGEKPGYEGVKTLEQPACDCPALSQLLLATLPRR